MARYRIYDRIAKAILRKAAVYCPLETVVALPERFPNDQEFAAELKRRFNKIPYPYEATRAHGTKSIATYEVLRDRGVLDSIFDRSVIHRLKVEIDLQDYDSYLRQIRCAGTELGKKFRTSHIPLAKELVRHKNVIRKFRDQNIGDYWIWDYLEAAEKCLVSEVGTISFYLEERLPSERETNSERVTSVYSEISHALTAHCNNHALFCHLTSIICSSNCLTTGLLSPSPEAVRKLLARHMGKTSR
jgi:hypothetical protein